VRPGTPLLDPSEGPDHDRLAGGQGRLCVPVIPQRVRPPCGTGCRQEPVSPPSGRFVARGVHLLSAALPSCHSVPLAHASAFRGTTNAQKRTIGSNSDQLICGLTSTFPDSASSGNCLDGLPKLRTRVRFSSARSQSTSQARPPFCVGDAATRITRAAGVPHPFPNMP
jgi:hypothetical protein